MSGKIDIHGLMIDNITMSETLDRLDEMVESQGKYVLYTPNAEIVMQASRDPELLAILNTADLLLPDGAGVVLGAKILGTPLQEKVSGVDVAINLLQHTDRTMRKFFLFGGKPGIAEKACMNIMHEYPRANVVGCRSGYFDETETENIVAEINRAKPEFLYVGMGAPRQERWIYENKNKLNCKVILGVGGTIDILAGTVELAPNWMRNSGLEWLYRLVKEPWRFKRMMDLPRFVVKTVKVRLQKK